MCPILKKLKVELQPYREVARLIIEILESKKGNDCRVLEHLLSFADYQFGKEVIEKNYRERGDGERISNWNLDMNILNQIIMTLGISYEEDNSLSPMLQVNMKFPHLERSLRLLNPYSDGNNGTDRLDEDQINRLLQTLCFTEQNMAAHTMNKRQFDAAEGHCERCLAYSRRYGLEGEQKTTMILTALRTYCNLRNQQRDYSGALSFAEECYNLVVEAYDPVHPQVQEAAGVLINVLIKKGDIFDAERYAQVTYSNLRDKKNGMDQEGEEMATGAYNLANAINQQEGDLIKAEELAKECLRIRSLIYGSSHFDVALSCNLLASILRQQRKLGDETKDLFERSLAITIQNEGPNGSDSATGYFNLGVFHYQLADIQATIDVHLQQTQLLVAKAHFEEAFRIRSKIFGPTHPETLIAASLLNDVSIKLSTISLP
jgi:hypothetical protein